MILEAHLFHFVDGEHVAAVEDDGFFEKAFDAGPVEGAELGPVGDDGEAVASVGHLIGVGEIYRFANGTG